MTPKKRVERYIKGVIDGTTKVGRYERLAVERHLYDLKHAKARGHYFDESKADKLCRMFPLVLRHTKAEWGGKPFHPSDNQMFIIWCIAGWRRSNGTRRFRFAYITCARKWGKSEFCAGLGNILTFADDPLQYGVNGYCAATTEDQAKIVHDVAKEMVRTSEVLSENLDIFEKSITSNSKAVQPNSSFKVIGSDSKSKDGFNIHFVIIDEVHEWKKQHRKLYAKLTTAHGSREQPLIMIITTAGDENSELWLDIDYIATTTLDNYKQDEPPGDNRFVFIARLDEARDCECGGDESCGECGGTGVFAADDPFDESNWRKANPNFPTTPKLEFLREQAADAKLTPAGKHDFLRYHCNIKVDSNDKPLPSHVWAKANRGKLSDWNTADVISGGWDIGGLDDLGAVGTCARFDTGDVDGSGNPIYRFEIDAQGFVNSNNKHDIAKEPWSGFASDGTLIVSPVEIAEMREYIARESHDLMINEWAFDPASSRDFAQALEDSEGIKAFRFYQNPRMWTEPLRNFISGIKRGLITHNGNTLLSWAASNMVVVTSSRTGDTLMMPDKGQAKEKKIDPIVAVIMAYCRAAAAPSRVKNLFLT